MEKISEEKTKLTQSLVIQMPNFIIKFIIDIVSSMEEENIWLDHLKEELEGLVKYMVIEYTV